MSYECIGMNVCDFIDEVQDCRYIRLAFREPVLRKLYDSCLQHELRVTRQVLVSLPEAEGCDVVQSMKVATKRYTSSVYFAWPMLESLMSVKNVAGVQDMHLQHIYYFLSVTDQGKVQSQLKELLKKQITAYLTGKKDALTNVFRRMFDMTTLNIDEHVPSVYVVPGLFYILTQAKSDNEKLYIYNVLAHFFFSTMYLSLIHI